MEFCMTVSKRRCALVAIALGATVFQLLPSGCGGFFTQFGLTVFDFCAVLNCSSGTFFDLCNPIVTLVDCPNLQAP
jgi:hypothetical protein